ncbi:MAG: LysM peptidoglycan-binding domain-containing protein [Verrucomicrobiae bacterium]|nr:LysM peptidoglycan-binding domain-containing protein [Verrucomicrobiae bacterium]
MTYAMAKRVAVGAGLILALLGGGCERWGAGTRNETHEANYIEGTNFRFQGQTNRAIQSFERALHVNPSNVQAHMAIADLFYGTEDFTSAAYHYRRSKRLLEERGGKPDQTLLGLIESCDLQLAVRFSDRLMRQQTDAQLDELRQKLAERDDTIVRLQYEIRRLQPLANGSPATLQVPTPTPTPTLAERPQQALVQTPPQTSIRPPVQPVQPVQTPTQTSIQTSSSAPRVVDPGGATRNQPRTASTPTSAISAARTAPAPTSSSTSAKPASRLRSYTVRRGDTLASIARRAGITIKALMDANPRLVPTRMRPGQTIQVPSP